MDMNEYKETANAETTAKEWMDRYGKYIETNPIIDFNGTIFVFSGLAVHSSEKNHPTVQKVIESGGQYRQKVSGTTNYLVVNPGEAGETKINAVIEQLQKGKNIEVISMKTLERALKAKTSSKKSTELKALLENKAKESSGIGYALVASERKSYKAVKAVVLKTGKVYTYYTRTSLKVGDKALIGFHTFSPSWSEDFEEATFDVGETSRNIAAIVDLDGDKAPKHVRVGLDMGFTNSITKKIINDCEKFINIEENDLILISTKVEHTNDFPYFRPISRFVKRIMAATTVIAFKKYASEESITRANEILSTRHGFPMQLFDAKFFYPYSDWLYTLELEDVYMEPDYESIKNLKAVYGEFIKKSPWIDDENDDEFPPLYHLEFGYCDHDDHQNYKDDIDKIGYDALDEYINKSVFTGAMAVMIQADLKNLMEAFLSANPPIDDYLDYMIEYANSLGAAEYVEMLKEVKK